MEYMYAHVNVKRPLYCGRPLHYNAGMRLAICVVAAILSFQAG